MPESKNDPASSAANDPISASVDVDEVAFFAAISERWWDAHGPFKPLHILGPARMTYIRERISAHFDLDDTERTPFSKLKILDIGCGGGLVCEPIARLGGDVTGIDASGDNIGAAKAHLEKSGLSVDYRATTAEALSESGAAFDVVLALEVVEHVADIESFLTSAAKLLKPGGLFIASTINRTLKSYLFAIVGAEYILRWLPVGAHDWNKFITPDELAGHMAKAGLKAEDRTGMVMNPLAQKWRQSQTDLAVNYFMTGVHT